MLYRQTASLESDVVSWGLNDALNHYGRDVTYTISWLCMAVQEAGLAHGLGFLLRKWMYIKRHALTLSFASRLFHFRRVRKALWE